LPKRGHNKAHRNDLRQVSLALAVGGQTQLPLFYWVYGGEQPDVAQFREVWPRLQEQMAALGLDAATVVYDKGNVSQAAQEAVDTSGAHYVTSVVPSYFPDLLAVPLEQLTPVSVGQVEGLRAYRTQMKLLKRERTVVMTYSPVLAAGQLARGAAASDQGGGWSGHAPGTPGTLPPAAAGPQAHARGRAASG